MLNNNHAIKPATRKEKALHYILITLIVTALETLILIGVAYTYGWTTVSFGESNDGRWRYAFKGDLTQEINDLQLTKETEKTTANVGLDPKSPIDQRLGNLMIPQLLYSKNVNFEAFLDRHSYKIDDEENGGFMNRMTNFFSPGLDYCGDMEYQDWDRDAINCGQKSRTKKWFRFHNSKLHSGKPKCGPGSNAGRLATPHPKVNGSVAKGKVCYPSNRFNLGDTVVYAACGISKQIYIKNCGSYYLYYLPTDGHCDLDYCIA